MLNKIMNPNEKKHITAMASVILIMLVIGLGIIPFIAETIKLYQEHDQLTNDVIRLESEVDLLETRLTNISTLAVKNNQLIESIEAVLDNNTLTDIEVLELFKKSINLTDEKLQLEIQRVVELNLNVEGN